MKTEHELIQNVERQVTYAAKSFSIRLMYEAFGYLKACADCGTISPSTYSSMSAQICIDWLNNGRWTNECERYPSSDRKEIRMQILKDKGVI